MISNNVFKHGRRCASWQPPKENSFENSREYSRNFILIAVFVAMVWLYIFCMTPVYIDRTDCKDTVVTDYYYTKEYSSNLYRRGICIFDKKAAKIIRYPDTILIRRSGGYADAGGRNWILRRIFLI